MATKQGDEFYQIEAASKVLAVLEALEGTAFEPVSQRRIEQRTDFGRDFVMRALKTLRLRGYAVQNERGEWSVGQRFVRLASALRAARF